MTTVPPHQRAALIVCGGQSRRMGQAKALLPFGDETILQRIVRIVSPLVDEVVLLTAKTQEPPQVALSFTQLPDRVEGQGPAAALADGLKYVAPWAKAAVVLGCDMPLITADSLEYLFAQLKDHDAVIPLYEQKPQSLAAVYRPAAALEKFDEILASGNQRLLACIEPLGAQWVSPEDLARVDPLLGLLHNVNTPDAYREALQQAGLPHPLDDS